MIERRIRIEIERDLQVTGALTRPETCRRGVTPGLVLAHGAKNDLDHPLLVAVAHGLAEAGVASVFRFNFAYTERGAESPDRLEKLEAVYRQAHDVLVDDDVCPPGAVFLGGKSLGARVAAGLASRHHEGDGLLTPGLVFLGYPLHAPGRSAEARLERLLRIDAPTLFLEGSRDPFCDLDVLTPVLGRMTPPGRLHVIEGGDHSLGVPASARVTQDGVYDEVVRVIADYIRALA